MSGRPKKRTVIHVAAMAVAFATLGAAPSAIASSVSSYKGGGKSAFKDTITIKRSGEHVVFYDANVETLCGLVNAEGEGDARQTVVWPVTPNKGEAALKLATNGTFAGKQHTSTTIPAIHGLTTTSAPGTYTFSITGRFNAAKSKVEGHLSLKIETSTGYFCTVTKSPFTAKEK
jgi:hypothetical protein